MKIYFSGWAVDHRPAGLERRASFMLTYFDLHRRDASSMELVREFIQRKEGPGSEEDCFIDSGAWSLYRLHVLKKGATANRAKRQGKIIHKGQSSILDAPPIKPGGRADHSFYSLKKGSEFRKYCDSYASFMELKKVKAHVGYFAVVDAIGSPSVTWDIQMFFEEEYGLRPVPIVHFGSSMKWLEKYLERGYPMIGLGGMARRAGNGSRVLNWCDDAFLRLCPESNKRLPITKVHGFAVTDLDMLRRWPWYSVDSSSYLCLGKYGKLCVPYWSDKRKGFRFDKLPMKVKVTFYGLEEEDPEKGLGAHQEEAEFQPMPEGRLDWRKAQWTTHKWLKHIGLEFGKLHEDGKTVLEPGVSSIQELRHQANLRYYMDVEASIPSYPFPLDPRIVNHNHTRARQGGIGFQF